MPTIILTPKIHQDQAISLNKVSALIQLFYSLNLFVFLPSTLQVFSLLNNNVLDSSFIPCHYQTAGEGFKNLIIFFHGNAEDIGIASNFTQKLAIGLKVTLISRVFDSSQF